MSGRPTRRLRIGTLNLLSGRSLRDGRVEPGRLAAQLARLDVDVLALQEVDRFQPRSGGHDQAALAAAVLGASGYRFVPTVVGTPGEPGWRNGPVGAPADGPADEGPSYGIALLSRLPVRSWQVLGLGRARGRYPLLVATQPPQVRWLPDERRAAVLAELAEPALSITATHLSFVPGVNARQLRQVQRWSMQHLATGAAALNGAMPRLLLGDLNLPGGLPARITGWTPLVEAATFPAPAPRLQLDHVLAHGLPPSTRASARVVELEISDHRAVLVDLELPG